MPLHPHVGFRADARVQRAAVYGQAGVVSHQVPAHVRHVDAEGGLLGCVGIVQAGGLGQFEMTVRIRCAAAILDDRVVGGPLS